MPYYPNKKQKTIKYPSAPSGVINIGKWVPPFMEVNGGFGFMGVVAEDSKTGDLQCHVCGKWFQQLASHYSQRHGMTGEEYRERYGLLRSTALKSKRIRLIQSKVIQRLQKQGRMGLGNNLGKSPMVKGNKYAANRKGKPKALESQNAYGVCDLQIITKIQALARKLGKTPSLNELKEEYGQKLISVMYMRYGSYIEYCRKNLKMEPNRSADNPWSSAQWRRHLIEIGREAVKQGRPLRIKKMLPTNEQRYVYKHFKSFDHYKQLVLKK